MAELKYPKAASAAEWRKQVGALDKLKGAEALTRLEVLFDDLPFDLFETDGLDTARKAAARLDDALDSGAKACKGVSTQAVAAKAIADKVAAELKKNPKAPKGAAQFAQDAGAAAEKLGKDVIALSALGAGRIKALGAKLEEAEKKAAAAGDKAAEKKAAQADKEDAAAAAKVDPKLLAHNGRVRTLLNKVRAGQHPATPFAFLQNKLRVPFNKSKPWEHKSITHVGPKAVKSCRSELEKLSGADDDYLFFHGELAFVGEKGKGKLVFQFESTLPNPKQVKDALLFQCKYSPPLQLRRMNSNEVLDEGAEGDEKDAEIGGDEPDEPDEATPWQAAKPTAVEDAAIEDARKSLDDAHAKLLAGIDRLMAEIASIYKGVTGDDLKAVSDAIRKLDALKKKLDSDLAAQLAAVAKERDPKERARRKGLARASLKTLGDLIAGEELIADLDHNDLLPSMVVVAPMKEGLRKAIALLN